MATEIRVPTLGESVSEATIGKWFKKVGDAIAVDEPLVELETDKVTIEVPASAAGSLEEITAKEGDTVEVGALLGMIGGAGAASAKKEEAKPEAIAQASGAAGASSTAEAEDKAAQVAGNTPITERKESEMPASPAASKLLAEKGVSVSQVEGSGKRGQVLKGDVLDAVAKGIAAQPAAAPAPQAARPASSADDASREER
ncbi:MAG: E3 binding domain-containing protein, partial [Bifidobacteriales bacterium]|nr:E3 binding domain-containing protein [Bifidobacteriales bacterium]